MYSLINEDDPALTSYEVEESDEPEIMRQIVNHIDDCLELPSNPFPASLIEPISEQQVEVNVDPFEYVSETFCKIYISVLKK